MTTTLSILGILLIGFAIYAIRSSKKIVANDSEKIKILTDQNFQHQIKNGVTLVDFWASWCMPCKMMIPILNEVSEEIPDNSSVGKIDIEQFQSIASKYNVRSIPTMILFKNGIEVNRFVGVKQKDFLINQINKA